MATAIVAFGANLGSPEQTYGVLIERLRGDEAIQSVRASRLLATEPVGGPPGQPRYLNAALRIETNESPEALLALLHRYEAEMGRVRNERWGPRAIDLDLLLYDDAMIETTRLTLPHPRMHYRRFVLAPAAEVAAEQVHPVFGLTVGALLANIDARPRRVVIASTDLAAAEAFAGEVSEAAGIPLTAVDEFSEAAEREEMLAFASPEEAEKIRAELLIWLSGRKKAPPTTLQRGVWSVLPLGARGSEIWKASVGEAAAAVAAMRHTDSEWITT